MKSCLSLASFGDRINSLEAGLAPYAARSMEAKRPVFEENCPFRGAFQRDRDRVLRCRPFRRLAHKTQVFIANRGDHHRTRLTHTLEVSQIARELARCFRLNEDLAEAASLAHDLGHTPFGHAGERTLNELCEGGFEHQNHSLRIVDKLIDGRGLNLTFATRDAIVKHSKGSGPIFVEGPAAPSTFEGRLVRVADIIAYLAHDLDDALKAELVDPDKIPKDIVQVFGNRASSRIKAMIFDLMENSETDGEGLRLAFSRRMEEAMERLRGFLRDDVYTHQKLTAELEKGEAIVRRIYERLMEDDDLLGFLEMDQVETRSQAAVDFIAGMTDRYAIQFGEYLSTGQWVEGSLSGRLFPKMAI